MNVNVTHNPERATALLDFLHTGLTLVANNRTQTTLGDRTTYVGASDIAKAEGCFRQTVLDKVTPNHMHSLRERLTLERGHWQEAGVLSALQATGAFVLHQLEIVFQTPVGTTCKFHLDLVLVTQERTVVLESKSSRDTPGAKPYESHEVQIQAQTEALQRYWHEPVFSLSEADGAFMSFPDLVKMMAGKNVELHQNVEGWLLCIGADDARPFGPYLPGDTVFWDAALEMADRVIIAASMNGIGTLQYARGVYPLCGYCAHFKSCPKLQGMDAEELAPLLATYASVQNQRKSIEKEEERLKRVLKSQYAALSSHRSKGQRYINNSAGRFAVLASFRTSILQEPLILALQEQGLSEDAIATVLKAATNLSEFPKVVFYPAKEVVHAQKSA